MDTMEGVESFLTCSPKTGPEIRLGSDVQGGNGLAALLGFIVREWIQ